MLEKKRRGEKYSLAGVTKRANLSLSASLSLSLSACAALLRRGLRNMLTNPTPRICSAPLRSTPTTASPAGAAAVVDRMKAAHERRPAIFCILLVVCVCVQEAPKTISMGGGGGGWGELSSASRECKHDSTTGERCPRIPFLLVRVREQEEEHGIVGCNSTRSEEALLLFAGSFESTEASDGCYRRCIT